VLSINCVTATAQGTPYSGHHCTGCECACHGPGTRAPANFRQQVEQRQAARREAVEDTPDGEA
jgi:hypothetical protein